MELANGLANNVANGNGLHFTFATSFKFLSKTKALAKVILLRTMWLNPCCSFHV
jgi:hypothetical protein